jgi:hypothetical protein
VPQGLVRPADEDLETAVLVPADRDVGRDDAAERVPPGPAAVRDGLPVVPHGAVGAADEDLEATVLVPADRDVGRDDAAERVPPRPAAVRDGLPVVVDGAVGAADEDLEAAVLVPADRDVGGDDAAERVPSRPAAVRDGLPVVVDGAVGAADEDLEAAVVVATRRDVGGDDTAERVPPDQPPFASVCHLCHTAPSVPRTKTSRRPSSFCSTAMFEVRTPPSEAQPDQTLGASTSVTPSAPNGPIQLSIPHSPYAIRKKPCSPQPGPQLFLQIQQLCESS